LDNIEDKELIKEIQRREKMGNASLVYSGNKKFDERYMFEDFIEAVKTDYGISFSKFEINENDPPDIFAWMGNKKTNVEIVRLMKQERLALKSAKGRKKAEKLGNKSTPIEWSKHIYWPKDEFIHEMYKIIDGKKDKYEKARVCIDCLLIASDELGLPFEDARNWIPDLKSDATATVRSAFYMSYVAGASENDAGRWKTVKVFGEL